MRYICVCTAPNNAWCKDWDHGKVSESCDTSCKWREERYLLDPCRCGTEEKPRIYKEETTRQRIVKTVTSKERDASPKNEIRNHGYFVECPSCGLRTEPSVSPKDAVNEWNCRVALEPAGKVITLCGSTEFKNYFDVLRKRLTTEGHIVLGPELFADYGDAGELSSYKMLEEMSKRKVAMSDEIFVVNVGGQVTPETSIEIALAERLGKTVRYLVEPSKGI